MHFAVTAELGYVLYVLFRSETVSVYLQLVNVAPFTHKRRFQNYIRFRLGRRKQTFVKAVCKHFRLETGKVAFILGAVNIFLRLVLLIQRNCHNGRKFEEHILEKVQVVFLQVVRAQIDVVHHIPAVVLVNLPMLPMLGRNEVEHLALGKVEIVAVWLRHLHQIQHIFLCKRRKQQTELHFVVAVLGIKQCVKFLVCHFGKVAFTCGGRLTRLFLQRPGVAPHFAFKLVFAKSLGVSRLV